jgi:putative nucleotidyltransferase with HDIG domain
MKIEQTKKGIKRKIFIFIITTMFIVFMFPRGESLDFQVSEGTIWTQDDLIAPFSFPILKDAAVYEKELLEAEQSVFPVYLRKNFSISDSLNNFKRKLIEILDENSKIETNDFINPTFFSPTSFTTLIKLYKETKFSNRKNLTVESLLDFSTPVIINLHRRGILNTNRSDLKKDTIALRTGNVDVITSVNDFLCLDEAQNQAMMFVSELQIKEELKQILREYSVRFLIPNIILDEAATQLEIEQARNSVSRYSGIVTENERIVAKHDRITKQVKLKIESYKEAKSEDITFGENILQIFGKFLHIGSLISILSIYLFLFRKKIFFDTRKLILIASLYMLVAFITFLINSAPIKAPIQYLIFIPVVSMILTITFDSRVGFYSTAILTMIVGALRGNDYTFMMTNFVAGALSVYTVRDIKNRTQIFRSFIFIFVGYFTTILAFGLERFATAESILIELAFASSNALISPALTYGLLIFIERIFKITTELTLLELSNYERPLLRDLATKSPGTFNHTLTVSLISESAAEKIGGNVLLARVGALYHDIGKTVYPIAFIENQISGENIHDKLTPEDSVKIILKHIDEGINLAKANKLPPEIIDFIPMHHGTSVLSYFYDKAKRLYGEENVDINKFRYKGPKPNSKETAIVMLADSCESAVRSIVEPTEEKIKNVINNIINAKLQDNQLDETPLNFSDINKIKETFLNILISQHHKRIKYPKQDEIEKGIIN